MQRNQDEHLQAGELSAEDAAMIQYFDGVAGNTSLSREEAAVAKQYGVYCSRQSGDHMTRIVNPGGQLTAAQMRTVATLSDKYSTGRISFTTRQSAQLHGIALGKLPGLLRDLVAAGMTTFHGCGDVPRNVTACSWASQCPHRRLDVLPHAKATSRLLRGSRDLDDLPRKFKVTYSGCPGNCGQPHINCVGAVAVQRTGADGATEHGFRVYMGGGLGRTPYQGHVLYTFVPPDRIAAVCRAACLVFREHGDRSSRTRARLKFVVERLGIETCRDLVNAMLDTEGVDRDGIDWTPFTETGGDVPDRPQCVTTPETLDDMGVVCIMIPKGELTSAALLQIAELADEYGDGYVYSTNRQNLELHGITPGHRAAVQDAIAQLGFATTGFHGLRDVVACVGTTYCPMARAATREMVDLLQETIHSEAYTTLRDKVIIHISGCPNACSHYYIADIGMQGVRIRGGQQAEEGYIITLGGTESRFGDVLGEYKTSDCTSVITAVLDTLLASDSGETLAAHIARVGIAPYTAAVDALGIG